MNKVLLTHRYQGSALDRWKVGHRLFFVEIQAIILAINAYDREPSNQRVYETAKLIRGSAATMQLAADFSDDAYKPVRDSMADQDSRFSGLFSADHSRMIAALVKLQKKVEAWPVAQCELMDSIRVVYHAHRYVCERFVGEDSGSLANDDSKPEYLTTKYMRRTLQLIGYIIPKHRC